MSCSSWTGDPDRLELLGGALIVKEAQSSAHATAIELVARALRRVFGDGWDVRVQLPVALDAESEPEPDVCVVPGSARDYLVTHPTGAALVVEVAASGLAIARGRKAAMYARNGIADYWVLNLLDRVLEVHREPVRRPGTRYRWGYGAIDLIHPEGSVSPLALPAVRILVADLLP